MVNGPDRRFMTSSQADAAQIDVGLRSYMLQVYNYMAVAMLVTGVVAYGASQSETLMAAIYGTPLQWVVMLAPLGLVFFLSARIHTMKAMTAQTLFWVYSGMMGLAISYIFLIYTGASITRVFFITATAFAGLSLVGYTTKKDLTAMGSFLIMGLIGIIVASVVNIFLASAMIHFVVSVLGVLIFAGLTAYDTQQIKNMYLESDGTEVSEKKAIMGALRLYLDFLNMFLFLLHLFGNRE